MVKLKKLFVPLDFPVREETRGKQIDIKDNRKVSGFSKDYQLCTTSVRGVVESKGRLWSKGGSQSRTRHLKSEYVPVMRGAAAEPSCPLERMKRLPSKIKW